MSDKLRRDDPKTVWQNQPAETSTMTLKLLHSKARQLRSETQRKLLGTIAGPLAVAFCYAFALKLFPLLQPVLHPLFASALAWSLSGLYFLNRGMWSAAAPADSGFTPGLDFCRREIERRRQLLRRVLFWSFGPILLALGTFVLALAMVGASDRRLFPNGLPFLALVVIWILAYFFMRVRERRELQREIDELNDLEPESGR